MKLKAPTADAVRRTLRTALAVTLAVASVVLGLVQAGIIDPAAAPWLGTIVVLATAITRFMARPGVDELLRRWLGEAFASGPKVVPGEAAVPPAGDAGA